MTTTRHWTQHDSHWLSLASQPLWLRKLSRGRERDDTFRHGDPGVEAGMWACVLVLGMGLNELKMCEGAQSNLAARERIEGDKREGGPKRRSRGWCKCRLHVFKASSPSPQRQQALPEPGRPPLSWALAMTRMNQLRSCCTNSQPSLNLLTSTMGPAKTNQNSSAPSPDEELLGRPTAWLGHQIFFFFQRPRMQAKRSGLTSVDDEGSRRP